MEPQLLEPFSFGFIGKLYKVLHSLRQYDTEQTTLDGTDSSDSSFADSQYVVSGDKVANCSGRRTLERNVWGVS